jgi:hypothetical protein
MGYQILLGKKGTICQRDNAHFALVMKEIVYAQQSLME